MLLTYTKFCMWCNYRWSIESKTETHIIRSLRSIRTVGVNQCWFDLIKFEPLFLYFFSLTYSHQFTFEIKKIEVDLTVDGNWSQENKYGNRFSLACFRYKVPLLILQVISLRKSAECFIKNSPPRGNRLRQAFHI